MRGPAHNVGATQGGRRIDVVDGCCRQTEKMRDVAGRDGGWSPEGSRVDRQRRGRVVDSQESVESAENPEESSHGAEVGSSIVANQQLLFAVVSVLLPSKSHRYGLDVANIVGQSS